MLMTVMEGEGHLLDDVKSLFLAVFVLRHVFHEVLSDWVLLDHICTAVLGRTELLIYGCLQTMFSNGNLGHVLQVCDKHKRILYGDFNRQQTNNDWETHLLKNMTFKTLSTDFLMSCL